MKLLIFALLASHVASISLKSHHQKMVQGQARLKVALVLLKSETSSAQAPSDYIEKKFAKNGTVNQLLGSFSYGQHLIETAQVFGWLSRTNAELCALQDSANADFGQVPGLNPEDFDGVFVILDHDPATQSLECPTPINGYALPEMSFMINGALKRMRAGLMQRYLDYYSHPWVVCPGRGFSKDDNGNSRCADWFPSHVVDPASATGPYDGLDTLFVHEYLHSIGLVSHSGTFFCDDGVLSGGPNPCSLWATGNPFDIMGQRNYALSLSGGMRSSLRWMEGRELVISTSGSYALHALNNAEVTCCNSAVLYVGATELRLEWLQADTVDYGLNVPALANNTKGLMLYRDGRLVDASPQAFSNGYKDRIDQQMVAILGSIDLADYGVSISNIAPGEDSITFDVALTDVGVVFGKPNADGVLCLPNSCLIAPGDVSSFIFGFLTQNVGSAVGARYTPFNYSLPTRCCRGLNCLEADEVDWLDCPWTVTGSPAFRAYDGGYFGSSPKVQLAFAVFPDAAEDYWSFLFSVWNTCDSSQLEEVPATLTIQRGAASNPGLSGPRPIQYRCPFGPLVEPSCGDMQADRMCDVTTSLAVGRAPFTASSCREACLALVAEQEMHGCCRFYEPLAERSNGCLFFFANDTLGRTGHQSAICSPMSEQTTTTATTTTTRSTTTTTTGQTATMTTSTTVATSSMTTSLAFSSTSSSTTSTITSVASGKFSAVDGGMDRACRGANAGDNMGSYYTLKTSVGSLEACMQHCRGTETCVGIEFNGGTGRCEVWSRSEGIGASVRVAGYQCFRYSESTTVTTTSTSMVSGEFSAVDGGLNRACRGANAGDNIGSYYNLKANIGSLEVCKQNCRETETCVGIEFNSGTGRCEVWTRSEGIGASVRVVGYQCFQYSRTLVCRASPSAVGFGATDELCVETCSLLPEETWPCSFEGPCDCSPVQLQRKHRHLRARRSTLGNSLLQEASVTFMAAGILHESLEL